MKCLYHTSQSSENIHISNRVCFHPITTDPGWMPWDGDGGQNIEHLLTLVSLSSFLFVSCISILLARHDSGELRCPAISLIYLRSNMQRVVTRKCAYVEQYIY